MKPGSGELDLNLYVKPDAAGANVQYAHHISESLAATATGWAGVQREGDHWTSDYGVMAGLRYQW